ncbi:carboxypeptidase-like regulatory domain-containing protein [Chitinophaga defluvii]|uniref:Carboxypeptidase-like regulatory domain-containing protein n=1 Tax=Chitinophaga defluvii TaxID=3163343 RepID=A0ABV2T3H8_9BACT
MKKVITGTLAMVAVTVGLFAFKTADAGMITGKSATDSAAVLAVDSLKVIDSLKSNDSLKAVEAGSITGKVSPADGATEVEATEGETKLTATITEGAFTIKDAKAGTYTVVVKGKAPYKDATIKDVKVEDGKPTDLGEIKLEQ